MRHNRNGRNGKRQKKGRVIGLKVTKCHPLDSLELDDLATHLAQYLQGVHNYTTDSRLYADRANVERKRAVDMRKVLEQIEDRRINGPPEKVSRMDPLATYDPMAVSTQASQHDRNAVKFDQLAADYSAKAEDAQKSADETQTLIRQVKDRRKLLAAEEKD